VRRLRGRVAHVEGVLNGTCNFVLGRVARGVPFEDAVREAQAAGFAEADPSTDLHGWDAAHKAIVLHREAFGFELPLSHVVRDELRARPGRGQWRQVVEIAPGAACVSLRRVDEGPFLSLEDADNCLVVRTTDGRREVVLGKGAGRWPTTTSVLADLLDVRDAHAVEGGRRHAT
jgi:homoserine dehydrogenase